MSTIDFDTIGENIVNHRHFTNRDNLSVEDFTEILKEEEKTSCLLCYLCKLLQPKSREAALRKRQSEKENERKRKEKAEPIFSQLDAMIKVSDNNSIIRILRGLRHELWGYAYCGYVCNFFMINYFITTKPKKWNIEWVKDVEGVGKKTIEGFKKYKA